MVFSGSSLKVLIRKLSSKIGITVSSKVKLIENIVTVLYVDQMLTHFRPMFSFSTS